MANQYRSVLASGGATPTGGDALPAEVLAGKTFTNDNGAQTGTMVNRGAVSQTLSAGQSYTIPEGYHNGSGIVTAASISPTLDQSLQTLGEAANTRNITVTLTSTKNTFAYFSTDTLVRAYTASGTGVTNLYSTPTTLSDVGGGGCVFEVSGSGTASVTLTSSSARFSGYIVRLD